MKNTLFVLGTWALSAVATAQTPWPAVQVDAYPHIASMQLIRHEQSILLGEGDYQTGLFFSRLGQAYSEQVQNQLVADAQRKGWRLQTVMRHGTQYVLVFSKSGRLLDIRLSNKPDAVEAVYSVVLNQQGAPVPMAAASAAAPVVSSTQANAASAVPTAALTATSASAPVAGRPDAPTPAGTR